MGHNLKITKGNRLVLPEIIRYNHLPCDGTTLYIWRRERGVNYITLLDGYEQYIREEGFSKMMPKALARYYKRLFCRNIETATIKNNTIKLPDKSIEHLGTEDIEFRIMNGLVEVWPKN